MTVRAAGLAALLLGLVLAACSVEPGITPMPSPTPTLNPNQLAQGSVEPTRTPRPTSTTTPSGSRTPAATPPATPLPTPYDLGLEARLPTSVRGIPLQRFSTPAAPFAIGGDMCLFLCASEPGRLADAAGLEIADLSVGYASAYDDTSLAAAILAVRFPGVDTGRIVGIRLAAGGHSSANYGMPPETTEFTVGSRTVTWTTWPPFYEPTQGEYLTASGDVLMIVLGLPPGPDGTMPADVRLMIEALP